MIPRYKQTPLELMDILQVFHQNNLSYLLFKCEHIFAGENKNLDILFEAEKDYLKAALLLSNKGFALRMSEKVERYKLMYCKLLDGILYSIHLHREIAWHGIKALDKSLVFERKKIVKANPVIIIPSPEDSILIHAAHVLFENFKAGKREGKYFEKINSPAIDRHYIRQQLRINGWEKGFKRIVNCKRLVDCNERNEWKGHNERNRHNEPLKKKEIFLLWLPKLVKEPLTVFYLSRKAARIALRKLFPKRKGCLIALIGVNGAGKSTLARKVLEELQPSLRHLGIRGKYYYYGWQPAFFLTKILSRLLSRKEIYRKSALMPVLAPKKGKKRYLFSTLMLENQRIFGIPKTFVFPRRSKFLQVNTARATGGLAPYGDVASPIVPSRISKVLNKYKKSFFPETKKLMFKEAAFTESMFKEIMFIYSFWEYYYRYLIHLRPLLQKNNLIITDRYFYDFYGQYPCARQSKTMKLLIKIFPKPDITFLLDAPVEEISKRGKTNKHSERIETGEREVFPREYLQEQKENYYCLSRLIKMIRINTAKNEGINTEESLKASAGEMMKDSWRRLL